MACSPKARVSPQARWRRRAKYARLKRSARNPGTRASRWMPLARSAMLISAATLVMSVLVLPSAADEHGLRAYVVVGDAIPQSLTGMPGDAARGRALVLDRASTCILCHSGPFPEAKFHGDLAPSLSGAGSRWTVSQLRLRLVDAPRLNPVTIMPSYYRVDGLARVSSSWRGKPILSAGQIEDIVAYLATLRD